jgi:hypothetical protein
MTTLGFSQCKLQRVGTAPFIDSVAPNLRQDSPPPNRIALPGGTQLSSGTEQYAISWRGREEKWHHGTAK